MARTNADLERELAELKAQVIALSEARTGAPVADAARAADDAKGAVDTRPPPSPDDAPADFQELVELLKHEVEDVHPLTCLAIFGLGVLTGRLLAR